MIKLVSSKRFVTDIITDRHIGKHRNNIRNAFLNYGSDVIKELKRVIETGKRTGRVYVYKGIAHKASSQGEAPASLTGRLANSFDFKANYASLTVFSTAFSDKGFNYPFFLEVNRNRPFFDVTNKRMQYILERDLQHCDL